MRKQCWGLLAGLFFPLMLAGCGSGSNSGSNNGVPPITTTVTLSGSSFDFGDNLVGNTISQTVVTVNNTGNHSLALNPALTGDPSYSFVSGQSCSTQLVAGASCNLVVSYTPTTPSAPASQTATINFNFGDAAANTPATVSLTGVSAAMAAGTVTATANPQVALYTITPPYAGTVTVSFGQTTSYGMNTWSVPTPSGGGPVNVEVAGMLANTAYHMRATVALQNGITANDADHTFTTGALPANLQSQTAAMTTSGQTPQGGIEMLNPFNNGSAGIIATDLSGDIIWTYNPPDQLNGANWYAPKQLSNGDYIALAGPSSTAPLSPPVSPTTLNVVREFDLAGNTIKQITMAQLNAELAASNLPAAQNLTLQVFHHDVTVLPNGHWLVLANTLKSVVLNGQTTPTEVLGDVIVDLDTNLNPVWVWNEFDQLDVNREGAQFPDWTHTNAIVYSPTDGNLLVSMRHQSWVVKVDYENGAGNGSILWRLGYQGDFQLMNNGAVDNNPADWFYGQHAPSITTSNSSGIFGLTLMDNGDFRVFPAGVTCGTGSAPPCLYSTIPVLQIDETAKTATLQFHQILPANLYNFFGGNSEMLANGNIEYDLCGLPTAKNSEIFEVTNQSTPQTVWDLKQTGGNLYRGYRLPSLYPGVQW